MTFSFSGVQNTAVQSGGTKTGVILNGAVRSVYSADILFNAQPIFRFWQLATVKTELGKNKGDTIKFQRYGDLRGTSTILSEVEPVVPVSMQASQIAIEVVERGFAVQESERLIRTSWDDIIGKATRLLGENYAFETEKLVRNQYRAAGALSNILVGKVANRAALTSSNTLNVESLRDAYETLAINKAVKLGGSYIGVVHPHQSRGLRSDPAWIDAHKYTNPNVDNIFQGEIGMVEGIRFVETTMAPIVKQTTGEVYSDGYDDGVAEAVANTSIDVYQALITGGDAVGWAVAMPVEFRTNGVIDFQRTQALGWFSLEGAGIIRSENCVQIESA